jgi:hypothetical protein
MTTSWGAGRRQAGTSYCGCSRSRLGSSRSENRTKMTKAHSGGRTGWTAPTMETLPTAEATGPNGYPSLWGIAYYSASAGPPMKIRNSPEILLRSWLNVLTELYGGPTGHLGVKKTPDEIWQRYYCLQARKYFEKCCQQCDTSAATRGLRTRNRGENASVQRQGPFEWIARDIAGPFPWSDQGNQFLLIAMDYFMKWLEAYAIPNK